MSRRRTRRRRSPNGRSRLAVAAAVVALLWLAAERPDLARFVAVAAVAVALVAVLRWWQRWRSRRIRARSLGEMLALTPTEFEEAVAHVLTRVGYRDLRRVGGAGDLGADLVGRDRAGRSVIVQCKRYAPGSRVGSPAVQLFIGMQATHHRAERGLFVTTSGFTAPAVDLASQHGITLIDGAELSRLVGRR